MTNNFGEDSDLQPKQHRRLQNLSGVDSISAFLVEMAGILSFTFARIRPPSIELVANVCGSRFHSWRIGPGVLEVLNRVAVSGSA